MYLGLKFEILYQKNIRLDRVVRQNPRDSCASSIQNFIKVQGQISWKSGGIAGYNVGFSYQTIIIQSVIFSCVMQGFIYDLKKTVKLFRAATVISLISIVIVARCNNSVCSLPFFSTVNCSEIHLQEDTTTTVWYFNGATIFPQNPALDGIALTNLNFSKDGRDRGNVYSRFGSDFVGRGEFHVI